MIIPDEYLKPRFTRRRLARWLGWFALANAGLAVLQALRYLGYGNLPDTPAGWGFLVAMLPVQFVILSFLLYPLVVVPVLLRPWRGWLVWGVLLYTLAQTVILVDVQVFGLYRFHLNGMVWNLLMSGVAEEILPISTAAFVQVGFIVTGIALVEAVLAWLLWGFVRRRARARGRLVALVVVLLVLGVESVHAWADATMYAPVTHQMRYAPFVNGLTAKRFFARLGYRPDPQRAAMTVPRGSGGTDYPLEPLSCELPPQPLNVLVVLIDGWRSDALHPKSSPNIWHYSRPALRFTNHLSTGNSTRYGVFGLFYGLYATYWDAMLAEQQGPVLIRQAKDAGYRFSVQASASLRHPEFDRTVFAPLRGRISLDTPGPHAPARDKRITADFLDFLGDYDGAQPFFGFLFYDSPHSFAAPDDYDGPFQPEVQGNPNHLALSNDYDPTPFVNKYLNAVHFVDGLVGRVLGALEARGLLENTLVVITGDHGEEFNDNGLNYWGHNGNFTRAQLQVPLVMRWPGREGRDYRHLTSHVDVAPTLLREEFGCTDPIDRYSNGRSLFDASPRPYVVASNYGGMAVIEQDQITVMDFYGRIDIVDHRYRPLSDATLPAAKLHRVLGAMARFYAK